MAKILIAEDMLTILRLFRDILESSGHVVVGEAKNSSEAIQSYEKFKPDILILDLFGMNSYSEKHKREINSFDVIEELYKKYKANIIIVTGSSRQEYIDKSMFRKRRTNRFVSPKN